MPIEVTVPKYVQIVNAVQGRIEDGTYAIGATIPSESELMREFKASRPIVVRALDLLRQDGWIESRQGKGRFVLGCPSRASRTREQAYALLDSAEVTDTKILSAGPVLAPLRAAGALGLPAGTPVIARQRLVVSAELGPIELGTAFVPVELASGTDVGTPEPIAEGLLAHLSRLKGAAFDHVAERIAAKLPTAEDARLLDVGRRDPLLSVLLTVCDRAAQPLIALDLLLPSSRHELEDVFALR